MQFNTAMSFEAPRHDPLSIHMNLILPGRRLPGLRNGVYWLNSLDLPLLSFSMHKLNGVTIYVNKVIQPRLGNANFFIMIVLTLVLQLC